MGRACVSIPFSSSQHTSSATKANQRNNGMNVKEWNCFVIAGGWVRWLLGGLPFLLSWLWGGAHLRSRPPFQEVFHFFPFHLLCFNQLIIKKETSPPFNFIYSSSILFVFFFSKTNEWREEEMEWSLLGQQYITIHSVIKRKEVSFLLWRKQQTNSIHLHSLHSNKFNKLNFFSFRSFWFFELKWMRWKVL